MNRSALHGIFQFLQIARYLQFLYYFLLKIVSEQTIDLFNKEILKSSSTWICIQTWDLLQFMSLKLFSKYAYEYIFLLTLSCKDHIYTKFYAGRVASLFSLIYDEWQMICRRDLANR